MDDMLDITLGFSLLQVEETVLDSILIEKLSLEDKLSILIHLTVEEKQKILLRLGYTPEFVATL